MIAEQFKPLHSELPHRLLVIEDSEEDYEMFMRVVNKNSIKCLIHHSETGEEALKFLQNSNKEKFPNPSLILLDLNLPGINGKKVLQKIKSDPFFNLIPVVIFSSSSHSKDIEDCYSKGANAYVIKPMNVILLEEYIKTILSHWLNVNTPCSKML
ncbi:response regulator [Geminocystis sp. NIES-3709]|uniref:response regulator n=1 Tax=Geminocystis sp. NIES-3709 TaxID=1617448 RepID=UPI0005FCC971|nr:response regulator [Geminocystis sp. NIES-3709]BAQ66563.1 two-component system response regulator [Geminocystis sp. NIES-3709]